MVDWHVYEHTKISYERLYINFPLVLKCENARSEANVEHELLCVCVYVITN